jgi:hypothetical protein
MPKLMIVVVEDKTAKSYQFVDEGRAGNPTLHPKNYVVKTTLHVETAKLVALKAEKEQDVEELKEELRNQGIRGDVMVKYGTGKPGRPRADETREAYLGRSQERGMPAILRFRL